MATVHAIRPQFDFDNPASFILDLSNPRPKEVLSIVEFFEADIKKNPTLGKLPVKTGWNNITPEIAVDLLRRNRPGANRKIDPGTVFYYANQMTRKQWKPTGQPVLIDRDDHLTDAQHRMLALLISGATIKSYVVTDIEPIENLFAYIDNSKPRTPATALETAGLNGVSSVIVQVIKIGQNVKYGVYNPSSGATKLARLSPADVLELSTSYPNAQKAARSASSNWSEATSVVGDRKAVVAYLGMRIIDEHGEDVADDFFDAVGTREDGNASDPIVALRKEADKDFRSARPMKNHHMLAAMILAFNAWHRNEQLGKRWMLLVNEDFPTLEAGSSESQAAE